MRMLRGLAGHLLDRRSSTRTSESRYRLHYVLRTSVWMAAHISSVICDSAGSLIDDSALRSLLLFTEQPHTSRFYSTPPGNTEVV